MNDNITPNLTKERCNMKPIYDYKNLKSLYEDQQLEPIEIAKIIGCKWRQIYFQLHKQGISIRGRKASAKKRIQSKYAELKDKVEAMINDKNTVPDIAETLGLSLTRVRSIMSAYNLSKTKREWAKKEKHPNWKGGYKSFHGYIRIQAKDHPHVASDGYIPLHRKIVEDSIGRYLRPDETVHHIDGDKANNDISNLMILSPQDHLIRTKICANCKIRKELKTLKMQFCGKN
jgi:hypothetical protein